MKKNYFLGLNMAIKYTNISYEEYKRLLFHHNLQYNIVSNKLKPYCIEYPGKEYRINGKKHREDGPAEIYSNGEKYWYLNDIKYTFEK